eukprot:12824463-Ditylum_brightwellii.AAC.1
MFRRRHTEIQRNINTLIFNDNEDVISTFDMNRIASFTFNELTCGEIFDYFLQTLTAVTKAPIKYTPLSLTKALTLIYHLLIYGSERC